MKIYKKRNNIATGAIQLVFACLIALPWPLAGQNIHAQAQTDMMTEDGLLAVDTQDATPNAGGPDIDVWYADGSDQLTFGAAGNPQPQVNILGNVNDPDGVKSLTYSLNGSSAEEVNFGAFSAAAALNETEDDSEQGGMGGDYGAVLQGLTAESDNARLDSPGDFNIEILTTQLNSNNTLELKAKDDNDNTTTKIIALRYVSGVTPTLPFTVDWEKVSSITDQTQIVDGRWTWSQGLGTVRSEVGYDRLVALGDLSWGEYEIEVPVTIHELPKSNSGGIGLVARWNGHFSRADEEPGKGWWNLGAYAYYRKRDSSNGGPHLLIRTGRRETAASTIKDYDVDYIQEGKTYIFKLRVEDEVNVANATPDASAGYFRFKVWEQDQIEPEDWQLELADGGEYQPRNGSVLLAAYNADVSFGKVVVRPLHVAVDYTVTANSNGEGKITLENSAQAPEFISGTYPSGTVLTLFPMPESDWEFANWSGDVSAGKENDNPLYFTIDADKTISANFESTSDNQAPVVDVGADVDVTLPNGLTIDATVNDDGLPGGPLTFTWSQISGPDNAVFASPSNEDTAVTFPVAGAYTLRLTASDGELEHHDELVVTVAAAPSNQPPVVDVGADVDVTLPNGLTIDATVNDDGLPGGPLTFTWSQISGPDNAVFASPSNEDTAVTFPVAGAYTLRLTASDGELDHHDELVVTVAAAPSNQPPVVDVGADVDVTLPNGLTIDATVNDDGLPGGPLTFTWSQISGPDNAVFASPSNEDTAVTFPVAGAYTLRLTASDGELEHHDELVVTVAAAPSNQPPVVDVGADVDVTLPNGLTIDATVNDDGLPGGPLTFTWSQISGPDNAVFTSPNSEDTAVTFPVAGSYALRLTVADGELASSDGLIVTVLDDGGPGDVMVLEIAVATGDDDAEERPTGAVYFNSSDLELTYDSGRQEEQIVGIRFTDIGIPQGAVIRNAYIQFTADERDDEATDLLIAGEAADDASVFQSVKHNISARPRTAATVGWSPPAWDTRGRQGPAERTPDLVPLLQETINRAGWQAGNAVAILITGSGKRVAESYNGVQASAPLLHVEYQTSGGVNQPPVVAVGADVDVTLPNGLTIDATVNDDGLPGGPLTYAWSQISGPDNAVFASPNSEDTAVTFPVAGTYTLRLTASDGELGHHDELVVTVAAVPSNQPPVVAVGADVDVTLPNGLTIDATVNDDGLPGGPLTFTWSQISGPDNAVFTSPNSEDTAVTFPVAGSYALRLTVADGELASSDDLIVTVLDDGGPGDVMVLEIAVATGNDDAEERPTGKVYFTSSDLELTYDSGRQEEQIVGIRFTDIGIPQGAVIRNAYIQFTADETDDEATDLLIAGEAADDASAFQSVKHNISARPRTAATVGWSPPAWDTRGRQGPAERTPDLVPLLQETINRVGWQAGNAVAILITGSGKRVAESYNGVRASAPLLHVEYQTSGGVNRALVSGAETDVTVRRPDQTISNASAKVHSTVEPTPIINQAPIVNVGGDLTVTLPGQATLDATVEDDDLPGPLSSRWIQVEGPTAAVIEFPDAENGTATFSVAGTYRLHLSASDGEFETSDVLLVTVKSASYTYLPLIAVGQ